MSENELVTVTKVGQPTLRISRKALPEHVKLGWTHVETVAEAVVKAVTGKSADDPAKETSDSKLTLKK